MCTILVKMISKETTQSGRVNWRTYASYFKSGGGVLPACFFATLIGAIALQLYASWIVGHWFDYSSSSYFVEIRLYMYSRPVDNNDTSLSNWNLVVLGMSVASLLTVAFVRHSLWFFISAKISRKILLRRLIYKEKCFFFHADTSTIPCSSV